MKWDCWNSEQNILCFNNVAAKTSAHAHFVLSTCRSIGKKMTVSYCPWHPKIFQRWYILCWGHCVDDSGILEVSRCLSHIPLILCRKRTQWENFLLKSSVSTYALERVGIDWPERLRCLSNLLDKPPCFLKVRRPNMFCRVPIHSFFFVVSTLHCAFIWDS